MAPPLIVVPLYIYPSGDAWEPLFEVTARHPDAKFVVVVNPNSGPGDAALPDANYVAVIQRLSAVPNVRLLGYVHCTYGGRDVADVTSEIDRYSHWARESTKLGQGAEPIAMDGIFFDEVPSDLANLDFMHRLSGHTRTQWERECAKDAPSIIVYNPGVLVDSAFYERADYVVAFEHADNCWPRFAEAAIQLKKDVRQKTVVLIHTCHREGKQLAGLVDWIKEAEIGGQFVTEQLGGGYNRWPSMWDEYVRLVASLEGNGSGADGGT